MNNHNINILGQGVMGRQIAALFRVMGYIVNVWDHNLTQEKKRLCEVEAKKIQKLFKITNALPKIAYVADISQLQIALTFEALVEELDVKKHVIASLSYDVEKEGFLTNTSSYDPREIHPAAVGFHFFNPIRRLKFAEVTVNYTSLLESMQFLVDHLEAAGFEFVYVENNRGYIGNFLLFQEIANAFKLIDEYGYTPENIDRVLRHMGRQASIFDIIDLVGVDVTQKIIANLKARDDSIYSSPLFETAIRENVFGKKNKTTIRTIIEKGSKI